MQNQNNLSNLLGVVLCGGESKRMGRDKGLMPHEGTTWAQLVASKLEALGIPVVISVNETQSDAYGQLFSQEKLVLDSLDIDGPLLGILSVHQKYPDKDLLPLACDMIDMNGQALNELVAIYRTEMEAEFIAYEHDGFMETLGAIYTAKGLAPVLQKAKGHRLDHFSLIRILDHGRTKRIPLHSRAAFHNYNSRNELIFPEGE